MLTLVLTFFKNHQTKSAMSLSWILRGSKVLEVCLHPSSEAISGSPSSAISISESPGQSRTDHFQGFNRIPGWHLAEKICHLWSQEMGPNIWMNDFRYMNYLAIGKPTIWLALETVLLGFASMFFPFDSPNGGLPSSKPMEHLHVEYPYAPCMEYLPTFTPQMSQI